MRHFLVMLFMLSGLSGHCIAAGGQPAEGSASTSQPEASAVEDSAEPQGEKANGDKQKSTGGDAEEPDCE